MDKIEELEQTLFELRGEIAGGRHVPPKTKVLQLADNPEKQWFDLRQAAMDRLKGENEALLRRLKELEESGARVSSEDNHSEDLVPRASWELLHQEKEELVETVRQREKRLLRLQEVCFFFLYLQRLSEGSYSNTSRFSRLKHLNSVEQSRQYLD